MLFEINDDLHDIANRLREVDETYRLFRNNALERFEVHNSLLPCAWTLCFVVPYGELDARTIEYAIKTRKENFDALEYEVNANNAEAEQSAVRRFQEASVNFADMIQYAMNADRKVSFNGSKKWF